MQAKYGGVFNGIFGIFLEIFVIRQKNEKDVFLILDFSSLLCSIYIISTEAFVLLI